jgi:hypothetical protein
VIRAARSPTTSAPKEIFSKIKLSVISWPCCRRRTSCACCIPRGRWWAAATRRRRSPGWRWPTTERPSRPCRCRGTTKRSKRFPEMLKRGCRWLIRCPGANVMMVLRCNVEFQITECKVVERLNVENQVVERLNVENQVVELTYRFDNLSFSQSSTLYSSTLYSLTLYV